MGLKLLLILSIVFTVGISDEMYHACGADLTELMWRICKDFNPHTPNRNIRSIDDNRYIENMEEVYPLENNIMSDHSGNKYNSMIHYRQRRAAGIVDECCANYCTRDQIEQYCKTPN